jgi:16S rRNA C967 or C1407 C5-methylase (RsmB/RsmF family)/NOL1/NOP2/fmu family ribosome biogenesis protein
LALPDLLLQSLENIEGFDREAFERVHASGEQVTSIRFNPFKPTAENNLADIGYPVPWCPQGRYLHNRPSFTLDPTFHAGAYYVQEASSMFLWHALQQAIGEAGKHKVLDLCAAPGGKSTLLAAYFPDGLVVANEVIKPRVAVLVENSTKWGAGNVIVTNNDPVHFQSLPGYFDVMMVDAPCSGSGLFRKDPEAVAEWSEANVQLCSQRQQRILADVLPALKDDGILIYSTCSYSAAEDEDIADWLVGEMKMKSLPLHVPQDWDIVTTSSPLHHASGYRFYPDKARGEGFYLAAFQRKTTPENRRMKGQVLLVPKKQEIQFLSALMPLPVHLSMFKQATAIRAIPGQWMNDLGILANYLYIKKAGTEIGSIKGKDAIPAHELALSLLPLGHFPTVELKKEDALQYLRRKHIEVTAPKGWNLVRYNGLPLGWMKVLPNRINNYYPAEWRILKD